MAETRKLAAILVSDVVGYSWLAGRDEELTLARLRALRSDLIDPIITVHHGRVVKRTGDGAIVEFRSVVDAVRCAIAVQNGMVERNAGLPSERKIEFRIGIHLGDVVEEGDGDLMGDGVNIAARLESVCGPGGICLSEDAYRQVRDKIAAEFIALGEQQLKNIARPVQVFSLGIRAVQSAEVPKAALSLPDKPSIAVLPFQNISGDPEQDYFCDGMVEDITTGLARINWLFVISRNSSFAYKGKSPDIRQVGRELGVRYVMEGSVRKGGNRLRISCQLIEAEAGNHVWADKYDGTLDNVFDLQDRITETVVGLIEPNVRRAEIERARRKPPENLGAYDLYLRALPHFVSLMPEDTAIGMHLMEEALKLDPTYAAAHAYLAWAFEVRFLRGGFNAADAETSITHARQALVHGSDDPTALGIASVTLLHIGHDFTAASGAIERALLLNASSAPALYSGAHIHALSGDPALAETYATRALRVSPFDPMSFDAHVAVATVRGLEGRYAEAAASVGKAIQANPGFSTLYAIYAALLALARQDDEAKIAAQRLLQLEPNFRRGAWLGVFARFMRPELIEGLIDGMSRAGLPE